MDKRDLAEVFRERVSGLMKREGDSLSAFARKTGIDRSALSQFLGEHGTRLPRAETLRSIAEGYSVSIDWLLGMIQDGRPHNEMLSQVDIEHTNRAIDDALLDVWRREALGSKIRYVPSTIPDMLRTEAVLNYEFGQATEEVIGAKNEQTERSLNYSRRPETDLEICMPKQTLLAFAEGRDIWSGLSEDTRREQIDYMADLLEELYPTLRLFLFDGHATYSAPFTVFGINRAAIYLGEMYLVINMDTHVRTLSQYFDQLIRRAEVTPDRAEDWVRALSSST